MYENEFSGIIPALISLYNEKGDINEKALADHVEMLINDGVSGFYVNGSSGECHLLSTEERKRTTEIVCKANKGRTKVIVHVGHISTREAVELAAHAAECGADAISALPPFYYKYSMDEICAHYEEIASAAKLPFIAYNIPALAGVNFNIQDIIRLSKIPYVKGIKFTSNDFFLLERIRHELPDFIIFNGYDETFLSALPLKVNGAIGSTYNFMAPKFIKIKQLFEAGKHDEAFKVQSEANTVISVMLKIGFFGAMKYLIAKRGIEYSSCRKPMTSYITDESKKLLDEIYPLI